jgi:hypothetical protein
MDSQQYTVSGRCQILSICHRFETRETNHQRDEIGATACPAASTLVPERDPSSVDDPVLSGRAM